MRPLRTIALVFSVLAISVSGSLWFFAQQANANARLTHLDPVGAKQLPTVDLGAYVVDFYASPSVVPQGGTSLIHWKVGVNPGVTILVDGVPVGSDGNKTTGRIFRPETHTLSVTNQGQQRDVATITIGVSRCPAKCIQTRAPGASRALAR